MDIRKDLEILCDVVSEQLADVTRKIKNNGMSSGDVDLLDKLTHTMKSIKGVMNMMDDGDYSSHYPYMGGSYARGRGRNARRDSMGRYSSEYGYSRNDLAEKLHDLMEGAPDERTRQEMQRLVDKLESM